MKMSQKALDKLKEFEGCRLKAYKCPAGVWTIGYGTTAGVKAGMVITKDKADLMLDADIAAFEQQLSAIKGLSDLCGHRWDALVDFVYNLGITSLRKSTLLKKIQADPDDGTIPAEFAKWVYAGGKKLPGLVKRRAWEAKRWQGVV